MSVVVVDDEELARMAVRQDLETIGGVEIVVECANGFEAIKAVGELKPDVLLLDGPKASGWVDCTPPARKIVHHSSHFPRKNAPHILPKG